LRIGGSGAGQKQQGGRMQFAWVPSYSRRSAGPPQRWATLVILIVHYGESKYTAPISLPVSTGDISDGTSETAHPACACNEKDAKEKLCAGHLKLAFLRG
jgi:hypothetical protein